MQFVVLLYDIFTKELIILAIYIKMVNQYAENIGKFGESFYW